MPTRYNITIRISDEERQQMEEKANLYGLASVSALIRFAVQNLPKPK